MSATIVIGGDFCPILRVKDEIEAHNGLRVWAKIQDVFKESGYNIINLEAPVAKDTFKPISKAGPTLGCTEDAVDLLKEVGVNMVTLANNHMMDYGIEGYRATVSVLEDNEIEYIGAGETLNSSTGYFVKDINGIRLGFINACETEFSIASDTTPGCRPIDIVSISEDIISLKKRVDYVVLILHGGHEHYQLPSPRMKKLYNFFIKMGANVVVNHHQHCFSGYEEIDGNYIFYGLGNLCFDHSTKRSGSWTEGFLLKLHFSKEKITPEIIPYIQCGDQAEIRPLDAGEKEVFYNKLQELNEIISNDDALKEHFNGWIRTNRMRYISNISPFSSKILRGLVRFKFIPSFLNRKKKNILYDMYFCESHRDIVKQLLNEH